jgi:hypothetical protein
MKKFGTPIGAAPGRANENVGLAGVGTPLAVTGGAALGAGGDGFAGLAAGLGGAPGLLAGFGLAGADGRPAGHWPHLSRDRLDAGGSCGVVVGEGVEIVVEVVADGGVVVAVELVVDGVELVVEVAPAAGVAGLGSEAVEVVGAVEFPGPVAVTGGHDTNSDLVSAFTAGGSLSEDSGAPGGIWKYSVCPVSSTTVTVHSAAEDADGSAARPQLARTTPAVKAAVFSFGRFSTSALSPPALRDTALVHATRSCEASYWLAGGFSTRNCPVRSGSNWPAKAPTARRLSETHQCIGGWVPGL